jgi:hypothetical protein
MKPLEHSPSLADALAAVAEQPWDYDKKSLAARAVGAVASALRQPASELAARIADYEPLMRIPFGAGTERTKDNLMSAFRGAVRLVERGISPIRRADYPADWKAIADGISAVLSTQDALRVTQLMSYCVRLGIAPIDVDGDLLAMMADEPRTSRSGKVGGRAKQVRTIARMWNRARELGAPLPHPLPVTPPGVRRAKHANLADYPNLAVEFAEYRRRMVLDKTPESEIETDRRVMLATAGGAADKVHDRLARATLKSHRAALVAAIAGMCQQKRPVDALVTLREATAPVFFGAMLLNIGRQPLSADRTCRMRINSVRGYVSHFISLAKAASTLTDQSHRLMRAAYKEWLKGELKGGRDDGTRQMGERHEKMLRALVEPAAFARWRSVPLRLFERAERARKKAGRATTTACVDLQMAIAADLLRGYPIRTHTLTRMRAFGPLNLRNVVLPPEGKEHEGGRAIHAPEDVKNRRELDQCIRPSTCRLIRLFEKHYRVSYLKKIGAHADNPHLFPSGRAVLEDAIPEGLGFRTEGGMVMAFKDRFYRVAEINSDIHVNRQLVTRLMLDAGRSISEVADLLGDSEETVTRYYKLANKAASEKRWHEILRDLGGDLDEQIATAIAKVIV